MHARFGDSLFPTAYTGTVDHRAGQLSIESNCAAPSQHTADEAPSDRNVLVLQRVHDHRLVHLDLKSKANGDLRGERKRTKKQAGGAAGTAGISDTVYIYIYGCMRVETP